MTWDADTFTELIMAPDSIPDLLVRLLVAATIQPSTQTSIGFESQEVQSTSDYQTSWTCAYAYRHRGFAPVLHPARLNRSGRHCRGPPGKPTDRRDQPGDSLHRTGPADSPGGDSASGREVHRRCRRGRELRDPRKNRPEGRRAILNTKARDRPARVRYRTPPHEAVLACC